jgi:hypothetical protein
MEAFNQNMTIFFKKLTNYKKVNTLQISRNFNFFNLFKKNSRCDIQSKCHECSRKLLAVIRHFHSNYHHTDLMQSQDEISTEYRSIVFNLLDLVLDEKIPKVIHLHTDLCGNPKNVFLSKERYLSRYNCNAIAMLVLEEAILQFKESLKIESRGKIDTEEQMNTLDTLELLVLELQGPKYKSEIGIPFEDEKMKLFKLQFTGKGIQYLEAMCQKKKSFSFSSS